MGAGGNDFMEMTCVDRLNYNYYYLAFDVVRESNYKMLGRGGEEGRRESVLPEL